MKFTAAREALLKPLQAVIGVVERRQTMPILSNVLLIARDGQLSVTATDLEVELVAQADVDTESGGEITVSGRKLLDICRALPEGTDISIIDIMNSACGNFADHRIIAFIKDVNDISGQVSKISPATTTIITHPDVLIVIHIVLISFGGR